jgi:MIP family channel proteins
MSDLLDPRALVAEAIGAFTLIFAGAGVIILAAANANINMVAIALAPGLAVALMMMALGHISGGHFNPAITIGLWVTRRVESITAVGYVFAQLIGAIVAAIALVVFFPESMRDAVNLGTPRLGPQIEFLQGVGIEAILAFFLAIVFCGTVLDSRGPKIVGGLAVGLVYTLDVLAGFPLTGAVINPARALGPALVSGEWGDHLVYWVGPIVGGVVGALVYHYVFSNDRMEVEGRV